MLGLLLSFSGCTTVKEPNGGATFDFFEYQGQDARFNEPIDPATEYFNPIISGFYPDPSICRKGNDYYMVHSTFSYYPGIPILHSRDLVHWEQIGHVLDRPSQLKLDSIRLDGGIYAPAINYNPHNDTFYLVCTSVDGIGNFVVKTKNPAEGWSDPIALPKVGGIDPSLFFDEDGKGYLVHNDSPEGTPEYDGHRAIWIHEYDVATDQTTGTRQVLVDGGIDKSKHPIWIEGPHLYKIKGKYYLMAAEGGTCENHSEVILTSDKVKGPYRPLAGNPILTQRDLPDNRADKVTSTGHADLIETPSGQWFAIFLGCRPYKEDMYNTGRETFLLPVQWKNGLPVILEQGKAVPTVVKADGWKADTTGIHPTPFTGNFTRRDDFSTDSLRQEWLFIRNPREKFWTMDDGKISLVPTQHTIYEVDAPAFMGWRQQHTDFTVTTQMSFNPQSEQELAGLVCYQNERSNIVFGKTLREGKETVIVIVSNGGKQAEAGRIVLDPQDKNAPLYYRIIGKGGSYDFECSTDGNAWQTVAGSVDATLLSTQKAGGFTGVVIGMYAGKEGM